MLRYITGFLLLLFIASCRPEVFTPKPPGYFRIDTPARHEYKLFDQPGFPYSFEYPVYGHIAVDTVFQDGAVKHPYWINVEFPSLNGAINLTYIEITKKRPLDSLIADAYGLSYFHDKKADGIDLIPVENKQGNICFMFVIGGNIASRYQFFATDSVSNFLRGSLYFDVTPNADSLKPATDFIQTDIEHLLLTLKWKTPNAN